MWGGGGGVSRDNEDHTSGAVDFLYGCDVLFIF